MYNLTIEITGYNEKNCKSKGEIGYMMQKIQKFGGAMLVPVLLFAFPGMIIGIATLCKNQMVFGSLASDTTLWYRFWQIVEQGAYTVFNQMPLLFAVGLPIMLAKNAAWRRCFCT